MTVLVSAKPLWGLARHLSIALTTFAVFSLLTLITTIVYFDYLFGLEPVDQPASGAIPVEDVVISVTSLATFGAWGWCVVLFMRWMFRVSRNLRVSGMRTAQPPMIAALGIALPIGHLVMPGLAMLDIRSKMVALAGENAPRIVGVLALWWVSWAVAMTAYCVLTLQGFFYDTWLTPVANILRDFNINWAMLLLFSISSLALIPVCLRISRTHDAYNTAELETVFA